MSSQHQKPGAVVVEYQQQCKCTVSDIMSRGGVRCQGWCTECTAPAIQPPCQVSLTLCTWQSFRPPTLLIDCSVTYVCKW